MSTIVQDVLTDIRESTFCCVAMTFSGALSCSHDFVFASALLCGQLCFVVEPLCDVSLDCCIAEPSLIRRSGYGRAVASHALLKVMHAISLHTFVDYAKFCEQGPHSNDWSWVVPFALCVFCVGV